MNIPSGTTKIGSGAFEDNRLVSVSIPNGVTEIEDNTFRYNMLTGVSIPNTVTSIGSAAFHGNQLTSVTIPNSVTTIRSQAFRDNHLKTVNIPNSVTNLASSAFRSNHLTSVVLPNSINQIGADTFAYNYLKIVAIPSSVRNIAQRAFSYNQLTSVTAQNPSLMVEDEAFSYNSLKYRYTDIGSSVSQSQFGDSLVFVPLYSNSSLLTEQAGGRLDEGGYIVNPASVVATYKDASGKTLSPTVTKTGDQLSTYGVAENKALGSGSIRLERYYRISGTPVSVSAPAMKGYSVVNPTSPYTVALANAINNVNFVYSNPQQDGQRGGQQDNTTPAGSGKGAADSDNNDASSGTSGTTSKLSTSKSGGSKLKAPDSGAGSGGNWTVALVVVATLALGAGTAYAGRRLSRR